MMAREFRTQQRALGEAPNREAAPGKTKRCITDGCDVLVGSERLFCDACFRRVPSHLKARLKERHCERDKSEWWAAVSEAKGYTRQRIKTRGAETTSAGKPLANAARVSVSIDPARLSPDTRRRLFPGRHLVGDLIAYSRRDAGPGASPEFVAFWDELDAALDDITDPNDESIFAASLTTWRIYLRERRERGQLTPLVTMWGKAISGESLLARTDELIAALTPRLSHATRDERSNA